MVSKAVQDVRKMVFIPGTLKIWRWVVFVGLCCAAFSWGRDAELERLVADVAWEGEVARNQYDRMTPPGMPLDQVLAPEELGLADCEPFSLELDAVSLETLVVDDADVVCGTVDTGIGRESAARVVLWVEPDAWEGEDFIGGAKRRGTEGGPRSGGAGGGESDGFRVCAAGPDTNGVVFLTLTNGGTYAEAEIFAYTMTGQAVVVTNVWTNDANAVVTNLNTVWTNRSPSFRGVLGDWDWLGRVGLTNGVGVFADTMGACDLVRFYRPVLVADSDDDGLTDGVEHLVIGTDPHDPDSDGDGWSDGEEETAETDPLDPTDWPPRADGETVGWTASKPGWSPGHSIGENGWVRYTVTCTNGVGVWAVFHDGGYEPEEFAFSMINGKVIYTNETMLNGVPKLELLLVATNSSPMVVEIQDCSTNPNVTHPDHIGADIRASFKSVVVNLILSDLVEENEETPGGCIANRNYHADEFRTPLMLQATRIYELDLPLTLNWIQSDVHIHMTPAEDNLLTEFHDSFSSFMPQTFYIEGITPTNTSLSWGLMADSNCLDRINLFIIQAEYCRIWDSHQTANRTTRAVEPVFRQARMFEDNERADHDQPPNSPMLMLGAWGNNMTTADVCLDCHFEPSTAGIHVLWSIDANRGQIIGDDCGNFATGEVVPVHLSPTSSAMATHADDDFIVHFGLDRNGDGMLSDTEFFPLIWKMRIIGNNEYTYCCTELPAWQITMGSLIFPDMMDMLDIFLKTDSLESYQECYQDTIDFSGAYNMRNGLGCHPVSLTQGTLVRYQWNVPSGFRERILTSDALWLTAITPAIESMEIGTWYSEGINSTSNTAVFSQNIVHGINFSDTNLGNSLGRANLNMHIRVVTSRASPKPKITAVQLTGELTDLYDFATHTDDSEIGYASRIQLCHAPACGRIAGEIFKITVVGDVDELSYGPGVEFDDFAGLRELWNAWIEAGH